MGNLWKSGWKLAGISAVMVPAIAVAVTQTMTVQVRFAQILEAKKINDLDFGVLKADAPAKYTLTTSGIVKAGKNGAIAGGSPRAGSITIIGSATQNLDITAGNYVASHGVVPSNAYCAYDGKAAVPCALSAVAAPGKGKTLLIGLDIEVGKQKAGSFASPSFDINIHYN